jgi:hypothetical protein
MILIYVLIKLIFLRFKSEKSVLFLLAAVHNWTHSLAKCTGTNLQALIESALPFSVFIVLLIILISLPSTTSSTLVTPVPNALKF